MEYRGRVSFTYDSGVWVESGTHTRTLQCLSEIQSQMRNRPKIDVSSIPLSFVSLSLTYSYNVVISTFSNCIKTTKFSLLKRIRKLQQSST